MDLYMIFVRADGGFTSLEDAWDEESISDNRSGWDATVKAAVVLHGPQNVRVLKTSVDMDAIRKAFEPITIPILGMEAL